MENKIKSLDFFRILGAILIFLCHIPVFNTGVTGGATVELFLVLSGFVIGLSYHSPITNFNQFVSKRLRRIYPQYAFSIILGLLYMVIVLKFDLLRTLIKFPIYLLCLQTSTPFVSATGFDSPAWYAATLMMIYVLYWLIRKFPISDYARLIVCIIYYIIITFIIDNIIAQHHLETWFYYFSPFGRIVDFLIGVLTAIAFKKTPLLNLSTLWFTILELICLIGLMFCIAYSKHFSYSFEIFLPIAVLFYIFAHQKGLFSKIFSIRIFTLLSAYTYSFYLVHYLVIMTFVKMVPHRVGVSIDNIVLVGAMFSISCILAYVMNWGSNTITRFLSKKKASQNSQATVQTIM